MDRQLIVPVDGSGSSWRAFDVALALAERFGDTVSVLEVACDPVDGRYTGERLDEEMRQRGPFAVEVTPHVRLASGSAASEISKFASLHRGAIVVMASHGKGRSAAVVGSVTEEVLHRTFGPIVLVGPHVEPDDFSGPVIATVDGSQESEIALPLATAWATELDTTPWIVHVSPLDGESMDEGGDVVESAYVARLAKDMAAFSGHAVEFDELHGRHPARTIIDHARHLGASMIVSSSHGRSGLSRLLLGSVAAGIVRNARCPVAVVCLRHPAHAEKREMMWAY